MVLPGFYKGLHRKNVQKFSLEPLEGFCFQVCSNECDQIPFSATPGVTGFHIGLFWGSVKKSSLEPSEDFVDT